MPRKYVATLYPSPAVSEFVIFPAKGEHKPRQKLEKLVSELNELPGALE